ncbi:MAG TPA: YhdP family protein, partial [Gammaproteobacteria bacterium]|nr:YhdP family protein [Gammaproteobacteria bacterium]
MSWQRHLWKWSAALFAALVILLAALTGVFRLLTPLVPGYRDRVEQWASQAIDHPVQIRSMGAEWGWHGPEVALQGVRILTRDRKRVVVEARGVHLGLSLWSLLHGQLPQPNRIVLVEPRVEVERDAQGLFSVRGLEGAQRGSTDWHVTLKELLGQSATLVIEDGALTLFDARRPKPDAFRNLNLEIDNDANDHRVSGDVQLPAVFGANLEFELDVAGDAGTPERWKWRGHVQGTGIALPACLSYWPAYEGRFLTGHADLEADAGGEGAALDMAAVDLKAADVVPAPEAFPTAKAGGFAQLQGRILWSRTASGWSLTGRRVVLRRGPLPWPQSDFKLDYTHADEGDTWAGSASYLRIEDLGVLAGWLPAFAGDTRRLQALSPAGDVSDAAFKLQWHGAALDTWSAKGTFQNLGVQAADGRPGFAGMDGSLDLDQTGGDISLSARDASVDFTPLFRGPLHADSLDTVLRFTHDAQGWRVGTDAFSVSNADASARGHGSLQFPADGSAPVLDLDASAANANARNKSAYFPVGIMDKRVVAWLDSAIVAGDVPSGSVSIHGKTSGFPWDHGGGVFDIRFRLLHGELDYAAGWPALKDLDADVRFYDQGLEAHAHGGKVLGDDIVDANARFVDLRTGVLEVDGDARGSAAAGLEFLKSGPLKERFGDYLDGLTAAGEGDVNLQLTLPVEDLEKFALKGGYRLRDASVEPKADPALRVDQLNGTLDFSGVGFGTDDMNGRLLGAPVSIRIRPGPGPHPQATSFSAEGAAEAGPLTRALGLHEGLIAGRTAWQVDGRVPNNPGASTAGFSVSLRSDLKGVGLSLPAPLGKEADAAVPLSLSLRLASSRTLSFTGTYAGAAQAKLAFARAAAGWKFDRGGVRVGPGVAALPPAPGLAVDGELAEFSWDTWAPYLAGGSGEPAGTLLPGFLRSMDFSLGRFSGFGQQLDKLHLTLTRAADHWQAQVDSANLAGAVTVPFGIDAEHPLVLDMERVLLKSPPGGTPPTQPGPQNPPAQYDPRHVPALRLSTRRFQYNDLGLDAVSLKLVPQPNGVALEDLKAAGAAFTLIGDGTWSVTPAGLQQSALNADIKSQDVAKSLQSMGYAAAITGDKGEINASLNWQDSPLGNIVNTLAGTLHVKLEDGQLVDVQPGAGRVFGLLSLNALPRRLLLNFSDVFAKGFGYDSIEGDFAVQNGDAYTQDLQLKAPAAKILIVGRIGLGKQDFDEVVTVTASVGATLPVLGAIAG